MNSRSAILPKVYRSKLCNYSVRFSPFEENKLALAQAQHFGIVGVGSVQVVQVNEMDAVCVREFQSPANQFDVCFNEGNPQ